MNKLIKLNYINFIPNAYKSISVIQLNNVDKKNSLNHKMLEEINQFITKTIPFFLL